jgi:hypothetical protein
MSVQNPIAPDTSAGHPVLDELVTIGDMRGTTLRQARDMAQEYLDDPPYAPGVGQMGMATAIVVLVDKIEELTSGQAAA